MSRVASIAFNPATLTLEQSKALGAALDQAPWVRALPSPFVPAGKIILLYEAAIPGFSEPPCKSEN